MIWFPWPQGIPPYPAFPPSSDKGAINRLEAAEAFAMIHGHVHENEEEAKMSSTSPEGKFHPHKMIKFNLEQLFGSSENPF